MTNSLPAALGPGDETRVPELLGWTLFEGMACGIAVASLPEVVADGETGFVVPPNDLAALRTKLEWIRDHTDDVARMGRAAQERVLHAFTWPAVVRHCLDVYARSPSTSVSRI